MDPTLAGAIVGALGAILGGGLVALADAQAHRSQWERERREEERREGAAPRIAVAVISAAAWSSPLSTCAYTDKVIAGLAWPSLALTMWTGTPAFSAAVAHECRKPWTSSRGSPARSAIASSLL